MFDQDLLRLFKFRGSRSTLAYGHDAICHAFGFYQNALQQVGTAGPATARCSPRYTRGSPRFDTAGEGRQAVGRSSLANLADPAVRRFLNRVKQLVTGSDRWERLGLEVSSMGLRGFP
jgi:hypothetical protein